MFKELVEKIPTVNDADKLPTIIDTNIDTVDINEKTDNYVNIHGLTPEENREQRGIVDPSGSIDPKSRIGPDGSLQIQAEHYSKTIEETEKLRENIEPSDKVTYDKLTERIGGLEKAMEQTIEQKNIEEVKHRQREDIRMLEKFKKWAKENLLGLSAIAITIAGLITTVIVGARSAVTVSAGAVKKAGDSVYQFFKKLSKELGPILGPIISALGNLLMMILRYGSKGLEWLSKNLWAIVIIIVVYVSNYYKM